MVSPDIRIHETAEAGPFGFLVSSSPDTALSFPVRVGCDYKWTIHLYEALDFDASAYEVSFAVLRLCMLVYQREQVWRRREGWLQVWREGE